MRIGIDATSVSGIAQGRLNGFTYYVLHIIKALLRADTKNEYYIYCRDDVESFLGAARPKVHLKHFKLGNRKLLQETILPVKALLDNIDLMFFPGQAVPLIRPYKSVVTIHDLHPFVIPDAFERVHGFHVHGSKLRSALDKIYWRKMLKLASHRADKIVAPSSCTRTDLAKIFGIGNGKVSVIYEAADMGRFNTATDGKDMDLFREEHNLPARFILCVGTHGYKNLEGTIKAYDIIRKRQAKSLGLVVVGSKRYLEPRLIKLLNDLGLESEVIFTGFFPDEEMKYMYQSAELLLFPSFYEGFGVPVLEAFACGTPVVSSNRGSLPEVTGEAALLVDPYKPHEIACAVMRLLEDKDLRGRKCQEGLERVQKFSWDKAAAETLGVFEKVFGNN